MKQLLIWCIALGFTLPAQSQHSFKITVKDKRTSLPIAGVSVLIKNTALQQATDQKGEAAFQNIPAGNYTIILSIVGYEELNESVSIPLENNAIEYFMLASEEELEEIVVLTTRTSRTIASTPTRIETIDAEEISEKSNMRPSNVSMLLHESTGLQVQQTSATSANAGIKVQGLDGRYTQLLKDGYPNFGNFASGLSILEIPPLDLKQVEIIKGPASTLYGGGAISGVINFISKTPKEKPEYNFLLNQSNVGQTNIGMYASGKNKKTGFTVLALYNHQKAFDVDKDHFSELPLSKSFTINPKLFYYLNENSMLSVGNSFTSGKNTGGDLFAIKGNGGATHVYFEKNSTTRNNTSIEYERKIKEGTKILFRNSFSLFDRTIKLPSYEFSGISKNNFAELSYTTKKNNHTIIAGANFIVDDFRQRKISDSSKLNNRSLTPGIYFQDTWDITEKLIVESGLRMDYATYKNINFSKSEFLLLPRISLLYNFNKELSSRLTGGLGYKTPNVFTEQTESLQYRNILPLSNVTSEKSMGATADINYKIKAGNHFRISLNQLFFITSIGKPLVLDTDLAGNYFFSNASKPLQSTGFETNLKIIFRDNWKLFTGYTYIDAAAKYLNKNRFPALVPRNKLNLAFLFEKEADIKLGLEGYLTGKQYLSDYSKTPAYWEFGFFAEKTFKKKYSLYINFENFTDQRQSKYKRVVNGPDGNPTFDEIWNHTEGFVMNGGIKVLL